MATHIKDLIKNFMKEKEKDIKEKSKVINVVDIVFDKKLKKRVSLKSIYKNKLVFYSHSSHFGYEFNLKKEKLLKAIKKELPHIEDIKIEIG